jgi:hypothetical protein
MKEIKRNIMFNKAGGNAGKNSYTYRLSVPVAMIEALGITPDDREVILKIEAGKVIVEKTQ